MIGLFNRGNMTVEKFKRENRDAPQAQEPSVREMSNKAIELLANSQQGRRKGFLLQVEGALIDKRSHANDAAQTLEEMKNFDDAVADAVRYAERRQDTLVIVTADHECAGFNIIEKGSFTNAEAAAPPVNADAGNTANNSTPPRPGGNVRDAVRSTGPVNGSGPANSASGCGGTEATETPAPQADDRAASPGQLQVVRRQPDTAAERPADLPEPPAAGSVELTPSAFTDRVRATDLRLMAGARPRVTGTLTSVTDVSELLLLVVEATFYDRDGKVAGTDTAAFTEAEEFHDKPLRFVIRAPRAAADAIAARVTVPELVNE